MILNSSSASKLQANSQHRSLSRPRPTTTGVSHAEEARAPQRGGAAGQQNQVRDQSLTYNKETDRQASFHLNLTRVDDSSKTSSVKPLQQASVRPAFEVSYSGASSVGNTSGFMPLRSRVPVPVPAREAPKTLHASIQPPQVSNSYLQSSSKVTSSSSTHPHVNHSYFYNQPKPYEPYTAKSSIYSREAYPLHSSSAHISNTSTYSSHYSNFESRAYSGSSFTA